MNRFTKLIERNKAWSSATFGTNKRTLGLIKHIQKELAEIEADPEDLTEWVDVILLGMDGYWRHGGRPDQLLNTLITKSEINYMRVYPMPPNDDEAMEHDRSRDK
jgi:hypothetical protein